eukprot:6192156-Pleurochrysis_carterae.AAC.5
MEGTHRTSVRVKSTIRFCESRTDRGRSPTATQGRGFPCTPDTDSVQDRMFTRLRAWRSLRRAVRVATRARGLEAMRKSMHASRGADIAARCDVASCRLCCADCSVATSGSGRCGSLGTAGSIDADDGTHRERHKFASVR